MLRSQKGANYNLQKHQKQAGYLPDLQQCLCPFSGLLSVSAPSGTECTLPPLQPAIKHTHNNTLNPTNFNLKFISITSILCLPSKCTHSFGQRSFSYDALSVWNSLPCKVRSSKSGPSLKSPLQAIVLIVCERMHALHVGVHICVFSVLLLLAKRYLWACELSVLLLVCFNWLYAPVEKQNIKYYITIIWDST